MGNLPQPAPRAHDAESDVGKPGGDLAAIAMQINTSQTHPLADLFPLLNTIHFQDLCSDIEQHGLINPIVRHDGLIVDGRNRLRACAKLGISPTFVEFQDLNLSCTPEDYIWSQNMARRHLTDDQRAVIALQWGDRIKADAHRRQKAQLKTGTAKPVVVNSPQREDTGKTRDRLAAMAQVGVHKIRIADTIKKASPNLLQKVASGEIKLRDAARKVRLATAREISREERSTGEWLPLETLWSTPRKYLEDIPKKIVDAFRKPTGFRPHTVGYLPTAPKASEHPEVMAVPGVAEAYQELERLTKELKQKFQQALEPVVQRFAELALMAPNTKVPFGAHNDEERKSLLACNARQKNDNGLCGEVGCSNKIERPNLRCTEHAAEDDYGLDIDEQIQCVEEVQP